MNRVGIEGQGRKHLAGLVPVRYLDQLCRCAATAAATATRPQATAARRRVAEAIGANRLGRRMVSACILRRRYASRLGRRTANARLTPSPSRGLFSPAPATRARRGQAMQSVLRNGLVRGDAARLLLFTPPFDKTPRDPGYIKGLCAGHPRKRRAIYACRDVDAWAFAELGDGDRGRGPIPAAQSRSIMPTRRKVARYKVEPYVIAADVYGMAPHAGRGGWTWYTGSAAGCTA